MQYRDMPAFTLADTNRFWSHVLIQSETECWPWQASCFADGYGQTKVAGRNLKTHRVAFFLTFGIDPMGNLVCHHCDNPACCNPHHLFVGTAKDNAQDCRSKGRLCTASGEKHGSRTRPERTARGSRVASAKLTAAQVSEIRALYAQGKTTQEALAERFGVSRRAIGLIIKGQNWRHLIADGATISLIDPSRRGKPGSRNHFAKLSEEDVRQIRALHTEGVTPLELAERFAVCRATIYHLLTGLTWQKIT